MTLSVAPYKRDENGEIEWLDMPPGFNELAGTEESRTGFWSSEKLKKLNLSILSTLSNDNIFSEGNELEEIEKEIELLLNNLQTLLTEKEIEYWRFRILNIKEAIRIAKQNNGGVCIQ